MKRLTICIFLFSMLFQSIVIFTFFPTNVSFKYQIAAKQYLENDLDAERLLDFSPLYLYLHIIARKLLQTPNPVILWMQIGVSACSAVLLFHVLRSFFSLSLAFLGTFAFITNRSVLLYTSVFEPEPFMIFFVLGFLLCMLPSYNGMRINALLSGIFLGLSLLTRSNFFPLIVMAPVFFWLTPAYKQRLLRTIILFEIPVLATMSFLIIKHTNITGSFTPFSMNPGYVFFEGNNPNSTGESAIYPPLVNDVKNDLPQQPDVQHVIYRIFARRIQDKPLSIPEINAYWAQKAKNFIFDHPVHFVKLVMTKINFFFHNYRRHDLANVYWNDQRLPNLLPTIPYALIAILALLGMVFSVKTWKKTLLLYTIFLSQFGIMLLTYISDRQRVVLMAVMIFFASEALCAILQKKFYLLVGGLLILALFPLLYMDNDLIQDDNYTWNRYALSNQVLQEAKQERKKGNWLTAAQKNAYALALAPGRLEERRLTQLRFVPKNFQEQALDIALSWQEHNFSALFDLAILCIEADKRSEAELLLHDLVNGDYQLNRQYIQSSQPYFYLARISQLQHDKATAITFLEKALQKNPGDPWVLSYLAALHTNPLYKTRLFRYFDDIDAEFFLGQAYLATDRVTEAIKSFSYVVKKLPEYRKGLIYLSLALGAAGKYEQAAERYLEALQKRREPILREQEIITIFQRWAEQNPQNTEATYALGRILQEFGHHAEALQVQQELLEKSGNQAED